MVANQSASDKSGIKNSDLQVGKATGSSPSFSMAHKMGLAILDMTTGKEVPIKRTYTFDNANGTGTISDSSGKTTIKPYHGFNTTTSSNYCVPLYATTANSDCYYVVKANGDNTNSSTKFGCDVTNTTEYWSDVNITDIGYGKCATKSINSNRPAAGLVANFSSVGAVQTFIVPWYGSYQMECWGAGGGNGYTSTYRTNMYTPAGGYGGYSVGYITLNASTPCYIVVGGAGNNGAVNGKTVTAGGYNGGGNGAWNCHDNVGTDYSGNGWYGRSGSGGGATHVGLKSGLLTTFSSDYSTKLLLVAGGGGGGAVAGGSGSSYVGTGGHGGGYSGTNGGASNAINNNPNLGNAGTQSTGNAFGQGGARSNDTGWQPGGGGGGGFYGGVAGGYGGTIWGGGGGGGSGYINTAKLTNAAMYGYNVTANSETATKTYNTTNYSSTATAQYAKSGAGYARITYVP